MRFRITVRGDGSELRGYVTVPSTEALAQAAKAVEPIGLMIASPMEGEPYDGEPDVEASAEIVQRYWDGSSSPDESLAQIATLHYMQALVIRGERDEKTQMRRDAQRRELHHFEVEQENARLEHDNEQLLRKYRQREEIISGLHATLQAVRAALSNHPKCDVHDDDDPITCGWKQAVVDVQRVLERLDARGEGNE